MDDIAKNCWECPHNKQCIEHMKRDVTPYYGGSLCKLTLDNNKNEGVDN